MQRQSEQVIEEIQRRSERVLSKAEELPDDFYLSSILGSMVLSAIFLLLGKRDLAIFVGLWPPALLGLARLVKERRPSHERGSL